MERIKVTISRESGDPIFPEAGAPKPMFLDDSCKFMVIKKNGGTVESLAASSLFDLLEFIERELKQATEFGSYCYIKYKVPANWTGLE